ncbi:MAG TPA: four-helix bundle copper-binding protein [Candidatus Omnitrophota bacterium]|nr:four-helix bundle copper-binding protein [Candidatus Omnitrophota bacterium]
MRHLSVIKKEIQECIDTCRSCHETCIETMYYCLTKGGVFCNSDQIGILLDCGEICETSANFMSRNSMIHSKVCGLCAQICDICAEECSDIEDDQMKACAKECSKCAQSCKKMAATG